MAWRLAGSRRWLTAFPTLSKPLWTRNATLQHRLPASLTKGGPRPVGRGGVTGLSIGVRNRRTTVAPYAPAIVSFLITLQTLRAEVRPAALTLEAPSLGERACCGVWLVSRPLRLPLG